MSASARAQQMVAVRIPHAAPDKTLYKGDDGATELTREFHLTIDQAAKLLSDLQIAVMGA